MRYLLAAFAFLFAGSAFAQNPQTARLGITHTTDPEIVSVLDAAGNWIPLGGIAKSTGIFTPVAGGGGGTNCPVGSQVPSVACAITQATGDVWSTKMGPNPAAIIGNITTVDVGTVCTATLMGQNECTGTPTPGSWVGGAVPPSNSLTVTSSISSGSGPFITETEVSADGVKWYGRGLFLDSNSSPMWRNGQVGGDFTGEWAGGYSFYRVRAITFTGVGNLLVTIQPSQSGGAVYVLNLPTSANGVGSVGAVSTQGCTTCIPNNTNEQQMAGLTLAPPTPPGTPASSGLIPSVNVANPATATVVGFTPTGNTLSAPLSPAANSVSSIVAPTGGTSELISNAGSAVGYVRLTAGSGTANANDIPIQPGAGCVLVLGSNTWINAFNAVVGASLNVSAGNGLGNCPTGGGGGSGGGGGGGNVFQANIFPTGFANTAAVVQQQAASGSTIIYVVNYAFQTAVAGSGTFQLVAGTGTNCGIGLHTLTPIWTQSMAEGNIGVLQATNPGEALCVSTTTIDQVKWRLGLVQQ
jgi:hypothetical protein